MQNSMSNFSQTSHTFENPSDFYEIDTQSLNPSNLLENIYIR